MNSNKGRKAHWSFMNTQPPKQNKMTHGTRQDILGVQEVFMGGAGCDGNHGVLTSCVALQ